MRILLMQMISFLNCCMAIDLQNGLQKVQSTKRKATAKSQFLGVTKTTIMKARGEKKSDIPETSLASLILSGTLKSSSSSSLTRRSSEKPSSIHSSSSGERVLGFPQPNTTPLRRGLKKIDRQLYSIPEEKCHSNLATEKQGACLCCFHPFAICSMMVSSHVFM